MNLLPTHFKRSRLITAIGLCGAIMAAPMTNAAGLLKPQHAGYSDLKIKEHHVDVIIEDMYATTIVEQVFHNPNPNDLEAIYSFPVPEQAAVGEFSYWIDGKPVTGEVVEKQRARQIYEQEKQQGRETALVEKDQYKTFDISVFPVKANQDVRIKLVYLQNTQTDTGIGRYVYPLEEGGVDIQKANFWSRNETVEEKFSFDVKLRTSYPIDGIRLPKHPDARSQQLNAHEWQVSLQNVAQITNPSPAATTQRSRQSQGSDDVIISAATDAEAIRLEQPQRESMEVSQNEGASSGTPPTLRIANQAETVPETASETTAENSASSTRLPPSGPAIKLNQDILLYWRHTPNLPASVDMIAYKEPGQTKGTYKLTLTPGLDLPVITQGRDWVFVLDISGSMQGKFASLVEGVRQGLGKLNPNDRFSVVLFNDRARDVTQGFMPADSASIATVMQQLDQVQPNDGTNLYAGLKTGIKQLDADRSTAVVLVTDGVANVGNTQKSQFLKLLEHTDLRLFTFIMGNSANRPLLEEMTEVSNGFAMSISNADDIVGQLMLAAQKMSHAAMRDIKIEIEGVRSKEMVQPRLSNTLYHGQQLTVLGHYYQPGEATVRLTGKINGKEQRYETRFKLPEQATNHPELERLWAFTTIEGLRSEMDYLGSDKDTEQAIIDTAVEYGLVTDYTSMLVVRDEVFKALNIERNNLQRVTKEQQARNKRANTAVTSQQHRVDQQQPMFVDRSAAQPQPQQRPTLTPSRSGSGGGAVSPWLVIFIAAAIAFLQLKRFKQD